MDIIDRFAPVVEGLSDEEIENANNCERLCLAKEDSRGRELRVQYAPFDHVNREAKVVIVGMTPGLHQARQALLAARQGLRAGKSPIEAARVAKVYASFSGEPMRGNLVAMLDLLGAARLLGIESTSQLWDDSAHLVHFTSALRYPVFVEGANWSGTPDMIRTPLLREQLERHTGSELRGLGDALIVPLGPKVASALSYLADREFIAGDRVLRGLPHPSGANAERIAFFLGKKDEAACSTKTNTLALSAAREALTKQLSNAKTPS